MKMSPNSKSPGYCPTLFIHLSWKLISNDCAFSGAV